MAYGFENTKEKYQLVEKNKYIRYRVIKAQSQEYANCVSASATLGTSLRWKTVAFALDGVTSKTATQYLSESDFLTVEAHIEGAVSGGSDLNEYRTIGYCGIDDNVAASVDGELIGRCSALTSNGYALEIVLYMKKIDGAYKLYAVRNGFSGEFDGDATLTVNIYGWQKA